MHCGSGCRSNALRIALIARLHASPRMLIVVLALCTVTHCGLQATAAAPAAAEPEELPLLRARCEDLLSSLNKKKVWWLVIMRAAILAFTFCGCLLHLLSYV